MSDEVAKLTELEIRLKNVEREVSDLRSRVDGLERNNVRHNVELNELSKLESRIEEIWTTLKAHSDQISRIDSKLNDLAESSRFRRNIFWEFLILLAASLIAGLIARGL